MLGVDFFAAMALQCVLNLGIGTSPFLFFAVKIIFLFWVLWGSTCILGFSFPSLKKWHEVL